MGASAAPHWPHSTMHHPTLVRYAPESGEHQASVPTLQHQME